MLTKVHKRHCLRTITLSRCVSCAANTPCISSVCNAHRLHTDASATVCYLCKYHTDYSTVPSDAWIQLVSAYWSRIQLLPKYPDPHTAITKVSGSGYSLSQVSACQQLYADTARIQPSIQTRLVTGLVTAIDPYKFLTVAHTYDYAGLINT